MPSYCVLYSPGPAWRQGAPTAQQDLLEHGRYLDNLMVAGQLVLAGPFPDNGGMAVVECGSLSEAQALVARDPAVRGEIMVPAVLPWQAIFDRRLGLSPFGAATAAKTS
ncbi:MAG: YciI family protein [Pseudomonadota bacterium]